MSHQHVAAFIRAHDVDLLVAQFLLKLYLRFKATNTEILFSYYLPI